MFDAKKEKDNIVNWIKEYCKSNGVTGIVIGVSGGKDSGVVAALCCEALGPENVVGLTLPCHSKQKDADGAKLVAEKYGFELKNIDLTKSFDQFKYDADPDGLYKEENKKNSDINLKPRLRMAACYYMTALLSAERGGLWITTANSNACEKYVGYYTRGGDEIGDIYPLVNLTVKEVIEIGEVLEVPEKVLYRAPDDGLSGQTDEEKLGISYLDVHRILRGETGVEKQNYEKIERLHERNLFKLNKPNVKPVTVRTFGDKKPPKLLYRLESKTPDRGLWYNADSVMTFNIGELPDCKTKDLPMDYDWRYHKDNKQWWSACSRKEDLTHWYSLKDALDLIDHGFVFTWYIATEYEEYEQETTFIKETALKRHEMTREEVIEILTA